MHQKRVFKIGMMVIRLSLDVNNSMLCMNLGTQVSRSYHIVNISLFFKVGLFGLIEEEWLVTLSTVDRRDITYYDFVEVGKKLARDLRREVCKMIRWDFVLPSLIKFLFYFLYPFSSCEFSYFIALRTTKVVHGFKVLGH